MITAASSFGFARKASQMGGGGPPAIVISGTAYPGNTLTSTEAGQWYVNGSPVSGQTGTTYVIRLNDIGYDINQAGSNVLTCWSPADIAGVACFWTPYRNVYSSVSPLTAAVNGASVTRWVDIKGGNQLNNWISMPSYNTAGTYPFVSFTSDYMMFSDLSIFSNKSHGELFFAGKVTGISTSSSPCCAVSYYNNIAGQFRLAIVNRRSSSNGLRAQSNALDNYTTVFTGDLGTTVGTNYVMNARADWVSGGQLTISRDNVTEASIATGATGNTPAANSASGSIGGSQGLGTAYVNGEYRCICLVNAAITATERSQIARYMGLFIGKNIAIV